MEKSNDKVLYKLSGINNIKDSIDELNKKMNVLSKDYINVISGLNEQINFIIKKSNYGLKQSDNFVFNFQDMLKSISLDNRYNIDDNSVIKQFSNSIKGIIDIESNLEKSEYYNYNIQHNFSDLLKDLNSSLLNIPDFKQITQQQILPLFSIEFIKISNEISKSLLEDRKYEQITEILSNYQNEEKDELFKAITYFQDNNQSLDESEINWLNEQNLEDEFEITYIENSNPPTLKLKHLLTITNHIQKYAGFYNIILQIIQILLSMLDSNSINYINIQTNYVLPMYPDDKSKEK